MARLDFMSHPMIRPILMLCAWVPSSGAQALPPSAGDASVEILRPVTVTSERNLDFGRVVIADQGGTVEITPDGTRNCSAALECSGAVSPAMVRLTGAEEWVTLSVRFDDRLVGPDDTHIAARLRLETTELAITGEGTLVPIGATAEILPGQPSGNYAGEFDIIVSYQ